MAVSKPDFTRQFGSAKADLTPVSNANYVQGWDFVGSTPPTKNDFTYLQNLADQRSIWLNENTLKISNNLSEITPGGIAAASEVVNNLSLRSFFTGIVGDARNLRASLTNSSPSLNFTADEVIVENSNGGLQYRIGGFNKTVNLSTVGAGGMDVGNAPANGWVAIYAIYNPTLNVQSIIATNTTSSIAPSVYGGTNLPSGYTATALISVWRTNGGSVFQGGYQRGRKFITPRVDVAMISSNPGAYTAIGLANAVPQNAVSCTGYAFCNSGTGAGAATLVLSSDNTGIGFLQAYAGTTGAIGSDIYFEMLLPVTQNIFYQFSWTTPGVSNALVGINGYVI